MRQAELIALTHQERRRPQILHQQHLPCFPFAEIAAGIQKIAPRHLRISRQEFQQPIFQLFGGPTSLLLPHQVGGNVLHQALLVFRDQLMLPRIAQQPLVDEKAVESKPRYFAARRLLAFQLPELLANQAQQLFDAGLRRLNVSLDTLDAGRFFELSRREGLPQVLAGLRAAKKVGFDPIKVNAVAIRGFIEHDAVPLAKFCRDEGFELRFIEYMPIGADVWEREKVVFAHELLEWLEAGVAPLAPAADYDPRSPAMDFEYTDGRGRLGIIASVSRPFCRSCNRIRLTAEGKLRNCLFALDEVDVKSLIRAGNEAGIRAALLANVLDKWKGHEINTAKFVKPLRTMHAIGG